MFFSKKLLTSVLLSGLCASPVLAVSKNPCPNLNSSDIKYYNKNIETGELEFIINANVREWQGKQSIMGYGVQIMVINQFENINGIYDSNNKTCQYSGIPYTVIFIENNPPVVSTIDLTLKR